MIDETLKTAVKIMIIPCQQNDYSKVLSIFDSKKRGDENLKSEFEFEKSRQGIEEDVMQGRYTWWQDQIITNI